MPPPQQNKPKADSPALPDEPRPAHDGSGSDAEADAPKAKRPRQVRGAKKAAVAALAAAAAAANGDDPSLPGYGTPVATKSRRNPLGVRHSSRKAAVAKYDDAEALRESCSSSDYSPTTASDAVFMIPSQQQPRSRLRLPPLSLSQPSPSPITSLLKQMCQQLSKSRQCLMRLLLLCRQSEAALPATALPPPFCAFVPLLACPAFCPSNGSLFFYGSQSMYGPLSSPVV